MRILGALFDGSTEITRCYLPKSHAVLNLTPKVCYVHYMRLGCEVRNATSDPRWATALGEDFLTKTNLRVSCSAYLMSRRMAVKRCVFIDLYRRLQPYDTSVHRASRFALLV